MSITEPLGTKIFPFHEISFCWRYLKFGSLGIQTLGTEYVFPLKAGFPYAQVLFMTGFTVLQTLKTLKSKINLLVFKVIFFWEFFSFSERRLSQI